MKKSVHVIKKRKLGCSAQDPTSLREREGRISPHSKHPNAGSQVKTQKRTLFPPRSQEEMNVKRGKKIGGEKKTKGRKNKQMDWWLMVRLVPFKNSQDTSLGCP